jgi:hypothetical protein
MLATWPHQVNHCCTLQEGEKYLFTVQGDHMIRSYDDHAGKEAAEVVGGRLQDRAGRYGFDVVCGGVKTHDPVRICRLLEASVHHKKSLSGTTVVPESGISAQTCFSKVQSSLFVQLHAHRRQIGA